MPRGAKGPEPENERGSRSLRPFLSAARSLTDRGQHQEGQT